MTMAIVNVGVFASPNNEPPLQFVELDENGEIVEIVDAVYIQSVADPYEQRKLLKWPSTRYYDLSSDSYTISGGAALMVYAPVHFFPNSSGRLYYNCEVTGRNANLDIYDITNDRYQGSFLLVNQGNNVYSRNGYVSGLNTSNYYSFGVTAVNSYDFDSYYATVSHNSL